VFVVLCFICIKSEFCEHKNRQVADQSSGIRFVEIMHAQPNFYQLLYIISNLLRHALVMVWNSASSGWAANLRDILSSCLVEREAARDCSY